MGAAMNADLDNGRKKTGGRGFSRWTALLGRRPRARLDSPCATVSGHPIDPKTDCVFKALLGAIVPASDGLSATGGRGFSRWRFPRSQRKSVVPARRTG